MPTVLTHPAIPLAVRAMTGDAVTSNRLLLTAALCSVVPDLDSLGFLVGVPYGSLIGHRGLSHSIAFALLLAGCALPLARWFAATRWWTFSLVFLSTISHGVLDAFTDDGLGVAFLSPFSNQRFFFPWRPIPTSPIGLLEVFSPSEIHVLVSELVLIWLPCLLVAVTAYALRRRKGVGNRTSPGRSQVVTSARASAIVGAIVTGVSVFAGAYGGVVSSGGYAHLRSKQPDEDQAMLSEAIENLETQAAKLAASSRPRCPQDFSALDTGRALRISMFYGYDEHYGRVYDRVNALSMLYVLTSPCRAHLSACGFSLVSRTSSSMRLTRMIDGHEVELTLFTSSLADDDTLDSGLLSAHLEQERLSRSVRDQFYRELVESDVVFYMGHSRLGGSIGFDDQPDVTTVVNALFRLPMRPVLEALRERPTRLKLIGMFSCDSNKYFRRDFQDANPSLSLILTTGDIDFGPAEQTSLGALESVLSKRCARDFHESMISVTEPDPSMTYLVRGAPERSLLRSTTTPWSSGER